MRHIHKQIDHQPPNTSNARQQPHTHVLSSILSSLQLIICFALLSFRSRGQLAMKVSHLFSATVLVSSTLAGKFSLPLSESRNNLLKHNPSHSQRDERGQKVLSGDQISRKPPIFDSKSRGSPIHVGLLGGPSHCLSYLITNTP